MSAWTTALVVLGWLVAIALVCALHGLASPARPRWSLGPLLDSPWVYIVTGALAIVASVVCPMGYAQP